MQYHAADYVEHLSAAVLLLAEETPDMAVVEPHLKVVQAYTGTAKTKAQSNKTISKKAVLLECKKKKTPDVTHHAIVALGETEDERLNGMLGGLKNESCQLSKLSTATIGIKRGSPLVFTGMDAVQVRSLLQERLTEVLASAKPLSSFKDAQLQLELLEIFIDTRQRDAAYLAADNIKRILVAAESKSDNKEQVQKMLTELEGLEQEMHEVLPFTF